MFSLDGALAVDKLRLSVKPSLEGHASAGVLLWNTPEQGQAGIGKEKQKRQKQAQKIHPGCDDTHPASQDDISVAGPVDALLGWLVFR
jgi:hypothetical protein